MEITMTKTAIRQDRALSAAHLGARLLAHCAPATNSTVTGNVPRVAFAVPAYVADQESHPPRGGFPA